jgi:hypothetical protein
MMILPNETHFLRSCKRPQALGAAVGQVIFHEVTPVNSFYD